MALFAAKLGNIVRFDWGLFENDFGLLLELSVSIKGFIFCCGGNNCFVVVSLFSFSGYWGLSV